ncbi:tRNA uridine-5-carboxymethylaminomethyl(34) synthesis enzyme MnmG [Rhizosaccharibacter radicis]|uniref:tRNA uridine 5-carboxymethylaminomethyl modification enzyme MnmG n=1 Tax=Rhizosaccharibacter radicis TaxID=2782605 RepID=A0ABT1VSU5_9PROT|nr:tRNA uridine-5-carboxymethylaminomethyl(34) synthesis enzyme MnmG [Acetobacteraceae bacterium KSS12]
MTPTPTNLPPDVLVIGGGHAGCEAAAAAARAGARTLLLTHRLDTIGAMSCNPAIGGIGKGHLVREIDALDGLMGVAADRAGIHFKLLNRSKGPAVHGPRAQADRSLYAAAIQALLRDTPNLTIAEGAVDDLILDAAGAAAGVVTADGRRIAAGAVVLTAGTFLRGVIHVGHDSTPAGRVGEAPAAALGARLQALELPMARLKTGTPPRLLRSSIDWDALPEDRGDAVPQPFSRLTDRLDNVLVSCRISSTTPDTHQIIRDNLHLSAVYGGAISGRGPRYCPSIEDKVVRFAERERHQVFLEPEALPGHPGGDLVYPNGISTSLPADVQLLLVRSMPGLARAEIVRAGYAVEYDHLDPRALWPTLELKRIPRLFLAGQVNGTTGYEEAAAQGLLAGLNAARRAGGGDPVVVDRGTGYLGVMIDDLTTQGVSEPYRMFTSRAEYRLTLRADNADLRLTALGEAWGVVGARRTALFREDRAAIDAAMARARGEAVPNAALLAAGLTGAADGRRRTVLELLAVDPRALSGGAPGGGSDRPADRHEVAAGSGTASGAVADRPDDGGTDAGGPADAGAIPSWLRPLAPWLDALPERVAQHLHTEARYSGYLGRQEREIRQLGAETGLELPPALDYDRIGGLSSEMRERLARARPASFSQAQRVPGVTPAALMALLAHLRAAA